MSFRVNNKQFLKSHNNIWEKVEKLMRIDFESKVVYGDNDKYVKTKIKADAGTMIRNFHNKKMSKEKASCKCLSIEMIDSDVNANKKIKTENYIDDDLEKVESDSDSNDERESDIDSDEYDE